VTVKIKVYSDFVCPFCYLGEKLLEEAIKGKDVEIEYMPFELRPFPAEPLDPWEDPAKLRGWEQFIVPTAQKLGLDMQLPKISPHPYTNLAFEGYHFAKEQGKGNEYFKRVFAAFFSEGQNIGEVDVLTKLAEEASLDSDAFRKALQNRTYANEQRKALLHAYQEANISAVPTFIIGDQVMRGLTSQEALEAVIEQEMKKQGKTASIKGLACDINGDMC
jgi:predicted DsbA family dithiol-disulfide isomerase